MNRFAELLDRLAYEPSRNNKLRLMIDYFRSEIDPDRGYALAAMTGELSFAHAKPAIIRSLIADRVDPVLFAMSYDYVGDLSETVALMWPRADESIGHKGQPPPSLGEIVETLHATRKIDLPKQLSIWLDALDETGLRQADDAASLERVALPDAEQQGEVARLAEGDRLSILRRVDIGDGMDNLFGEADAAEAGDGDGVAAVDQAHGFARRDDLVGRARARGRYHRSRGHENIPQTLAKIPAAPMPVPMHMEIIPYLRLSRCRALIRVAVRMAPVAPNRI